MTYHQSVLIIATFSSADDARKWSAQQREDGYSCNAPRTLGGEEWTVEASKFETIEVVKL